MKTGESEKVKELYKRRIQKWEDELRGPIPRKTRPKALVFLLFCLVLPLFGFLCVGVTYFVFNVLLNFNNDAYLSLWLIPFLTLLVLFTFKARSERKVVQCWEKCTGRIVGIHREYLGGREASVYEVAYEYGGGSFPAVIKRGDLEIGGLAKSEVGDPVILLIDPHNPKAYLPYCDSSWKAVARNQALIQ